MIETASRSKPLLSGFGPASGQGDLKGSLQNLVADMKRELLDALIIAHYRAAETPFAAQYVVQQPVICVGRNAVDLVIGRHHRLHFGALYRFFEGREEIFPKRAFRDFRRPYIGAAFRLAMAG